MLKILYTYRDVVTTTLRRLAKRRREARHVFSRTEYRNHGFVQSIYVADHLLLASWTSHMWSEVDMETEVEMGILFLVNPI